MVPLMMSVWAVSRLALPTTQLPGGLSATLPDRKSQSLEARMPLPSSAYICQPKSSCFSLLRQRTRWAFSLPRDRTGNKIAARIAMMAITTSNSINVNACFAFIFNFVINKWPPRAKKGHYFTTKSGADIHERYLDALFHTLGQSHVSRLDIQRHVLVVVNIHKHSQFRIKPFIAADNPFLDVDDRAYRGGGSGFGFDIAGNQEMHTVMAVMLLPILESIGGIDRHDPGGIVNVMTRGPTVADIDGMAGQRL